MDTASDNQSRRPPLGTPAPDLRLRSTPDQFVELRDFRGRPVVLVFYPADWSPVCSDQLVLYQEIMPELAQHDAQVLAISVDSAWCHAAFAQQRNLRFPLLADFEPKGAVARSYGVYRTGDGFSERALFVIDGVGNVFLDLCVARGREPRRKWHLARVEGPRKERSSSMSSIMEDAVLTEEVSVERDHIRGRLDAPVTLVEYGDYQCPYCANANKVVHAIEDRMSDYVRFVFRHFPMTTVHPHAELAAEAAEAAGKQNRFWAMHDALFQNQSDLRVPSLAAIATAIGLDMQVFSNDLVRHVHLARVRSDFKSGVLSGVNGTPAFYINGHRHDGSWDFVTLSSALLAAQ